MKICITLIILLLLASCSNKKSDIIGVESGGEYFALDHAAKEAVVSDNEDEGLVCKRVQKTGSHFKVKRCTTKTQLERESSKSKDDFARYSEITSKKLIRSKGGG